MVITDAAIRAVRTRWMERDDDSAIRAINGVTLELERKFPLSVQACQVDV